MRELVLPLGTSEEEMEYIEEVAELLGMVIKKGDHVRDGERKER